MLSQVKATAVRLLTFRFKPTCFQSPISYIYPWVRVYGDLLGADFRARIEKSVRL